MSLASLYLELHRHAERTGEDRALDLRGGARIADRVTQGITTLTISRSKKRVGDTELQTFRRDCGVPPEATRYPTEGQASRKDDAGVTWWYVAYRWRVESAQEAADAT